ncbi:MAG: ATP-binding protein [Caldilineaceae bacterium SB0662_bin_9]|uniref:ATP-binding protein n=1 Tax=Caldilineaceae bacterium SB0662_bin_9 TaxID=2605258 RepID=A0A6B1DY56_9CHLR|nr:ATP-binding protein [Caldilineaceae bacterium SB0662_bin_9]
MTDSMDSARYVMRISRMTVDKLGVRLYDRVSAVVAELIANAYDADAENVVVRVPLATLLARKNRTTGKVEDHCHIIEVKDDGHGMTPEEANAYFLRVGKDRRADPNQGKRSRQKRRSVMGRKGIGKLAAFGICKRIEILSAGGNGTNDGYLVSHFIMDYDKILTDEDTPVPMDVGDQDRTYRPEAGTTVRLIDFLPKRVPNQETFHRQMARRFGLRQSDFKVSIDDTRNPQENLRFEIGSLEIPLMENTRVDVSDKPVPLLNEQRNLPVSRWMGLAKEAYKNEEMTGVRIYARGKIVATTRAFGQPAGFTGEFTVRSYLVGEIHAEWLDEDEGDDLVTTDRQDILWESDYGRAFREWGAEWIRKIAANSRKPRRKRVEQLFLEVSGLEAKAAERFADNDIVSTAMELGKQVGRFAAEDELGDREYVDGLVQVVLSVAPHKALMDAFEAFNQEMFGEDSGIDSLLNLFSKTRIAEMASYAQIAYERVRAIKKLEQILDESGAEHVLQQIVTEAPWLIDATWTPITANQSLKLFARKFAVFYKKRHGEKVTFSIDYGNKRPDFTLVNLGQRLHTVEIKAAGHVFHNADWDRLHNYLEAFQDFFDANIQLASDFPQKWVVDLVCDDVQITDRDKNSAYKYWRDNESRIKQISWNDFLARAVQANETFLAAADRVREEESRLDTDSNSS